MAVEYRGWSHEELVAEARRRGIAMPERLTRDQLMGHLSEAPRRSRLNTARALLSTLVERVRTAIPSAAPAQAAPSRPPSMGPSETRPSSLQVTPVAVGGAEPAGQSADAGGVVDVVVDVRGRTHEHESESERESARERERESARESESESESGRERESARESEREGESAGLGWERAGEPAVEARSSSGALLIRWTVPANALERARRMVAAPAALTARIVSVEADPDDVVRRTVIDREVGLEGEWLLATVAAGARCTAAVGLVDGERFHSIAHSPVVRMLGSN